MRSIVSVLLVITAGISLLWWGTDGFRAYTAEGARRLAVLEEPRPVPSTVMQDQDGQTVTFGDYQGRLLLITFVYTRCVDVCPFLAKSFQDVYEGLPQKWLGRDVAMLTISFDTGHDTVATLHKYAQYFGADGKNWRMVRVPDPGELQRLLDRFGVVVIPDEYGGFEHNAAIYLVDREGKLVRIFEFDNPQSVIQFVDESLSAA